MNDEFQIEPGEVAEKLKGGEIQLVDVRAQKEVEAGRIPGAVHIEFSELTKHLDDIDRDRPVVFHCRGGGRSQRATDAFRNSGYDAYNMPGGFKRWFEEGLASEPDDATVADH